MDANKEVRIAVVVGITKAIIESIPDELLFEILLHLPAQDIYYTVRLVCRKWYHMTRNNSFLCTHFHHASYGLVYKDKHDDVVFMYARGGEIETYKLMNNKFRSLMWPSCNGLVLKKEKHDKVFVVANFTTGETFHLPPYPCDIYFSFLFGIGYASTSMTYKVVTTNGFRLSKRCGILTVGVDKSWRSICTPHLSSTAVNALAYPSLITEGFIHWYEETQVVTLNFETEIITETSPPIPIIARKERRSYYYFSTGRYVSLLISSGELTWEVWEMKPATGEWRKLPDMCLKGEKGRMEELGIKENARIEPCGWVKYLDGLALNCRDFVYFYNLCKREICSENVITYCGYGILLRKNKAFNT